MDRIHRVVRRIDALIREQQVTHSQSVPKALDEEMQRYPAADRSVLSADVLDWIKRNAIFTNDGLWSIEAAVAKLPEE